jgi:hypothetical protein
LARGSQERKGGGGGVKRVFTRGGEVRQGEVQRGVGCGEGRAPVWGSEFTSKRRRTTGGVQQKPL